MRRMCAELGKKSEAHGYWRFISTRVLICLLITLAYSLLPSAAVLAEHSAGERKMDARFTDYEDLYFSILDITAGPEDEAQFDSLSESAQAMYIAAIFDMEVQNGGLCQFFVNCGPSYAEKVGDTLKMIGLEPMGVLYESFLSDNQIDPTDLDSFRSNTVDDFIAQYERYPFDSFDDAYMDLWGELDFHNAMLRYANAHPEGFLQP